MVDLHECVTRGHDWDFTMTLGRVYPSIVFCRRDCGLLPATVLAPEVKR